MRLNEALEACKNKYVKTNDTCDPSAFSIASTVAVQREGSGSWMHGVIYKVNGSDKRG